MEYKIKKISMGQLKVLINENRLEKLINKYINKYGIYTASKMMGLSITEVVELSNIMITPEIANEILYENMRVNELKKILNTRLRDIIIIYTSILISYDIISYKSFNSK